MAAADKCREFDVEESYIGFFTTGRELKRLYCITNSCIPTIDVTVVVSVR